MWGVGRQRIWRVLGTQKGNQQRMGNKSKSGVLVNWSRSNKRPKADLNNRNVLSHSCRNTSLKLRYKQGHASSKALGRTLFQTPLLALVLPWLVSVCLQSSSHGICPACISISLFPFFIRICFTLDQGPLLTFFLFDHLCYDPVSQ